MKPEQHHIRNHSDRRSWLQAAGGGFGLVALASMLGKSSVATAFEPIGDVTGQSDSPKGHPHFSPKVKRVIHIFLEGGLSQMDSFDPKPELHRRNGESIPHADELGNEAQEPSNPPSRHIAYGSPFTFRKHGESGLEISELFPHIAKHADKLCVIRSMMGDDPAHQQAMMLMNCGDTRLVRPAMGSWVTYGLGSENENLPGFVVLYNQSQPLKGPENWQSAFLPGVYQATSVDTQFEQVEKLLSNIRSSVVRKDDQAKQIELLNALNRLHRKDGRQSDQRLEAKIRTSELAFRMQTEAAQVFDLSSESKETRELYGDSSTGRQCLLARRLAESGVRFVQLYCGQWDHHSDLESSIRESSSDVDRPIGALLTDLARSGLLEDTLVVCSSEFGRTPTADTNDSAVGKAPGRDHNHRGFSLWLAGGGVRGGMAYGTTDDFGWSATENPVHVHDLHATILHLLGLDHKRLTYRYAGRDFRLTDVHGKLVNDILT
jgi:hypothetical protein